MKIPPNHSLCPVLLCLSFICFTMSVQKSIKVERNQSKHLEEEKQVHHRPKRGWVWNQFFVLEEHIGPEAQYVGKLHSNADKGDGSVKYILSGEGAGSIFVIDDSTGDIHATKSLDREQRVHYILHAQALDRKTNKPLEPESEFIIKVQDINDNAPAFLEGPYSASVPEMSEVGTSVLQITATDADDPTYGNSARVVYSILQGQPYFSVDPNTGIIRTALPNMDREAREQYSVVIQAKDMAGQIGGLSGSTTINITLTDANDNPPRFPQKHYQLYVPESATVGTAVGKIKATDPDIGVNADMKYSIIDGDGLGIFTISTDKDTREGVIILKKPLNYEKKKVFTIKIEGENTHIDPHFWNLGPFKDTANLKIIVGDVDEPPVFSEPFYVMDVYENTKLGTVVGAVTAQDPDSAKNLIRYFIEHDEEAEGYFNVDANSGVIKTMKQLDRENTPWLNITIIASEHDNPLQLTQVPVAIQVLDVNDNTPELAEDYDTILCENAKPGQVIQTVRAVDKDDFANGPRFYFSFVEGFPPNPNFTLRDNEAIIVLFITLKRSKKEPLIISEEDIRENVVTYDDEGGGEEDTEAFDITALRNPAVAEEVRFRRDVRPDVQPVPRHRPPSAPNSPDIHEFITQKLQEADLDLSVPPYDSLQTYAYEGHGSIAGSISSLDSVTTHSEQDYNYIGDWGPQFKKLSELYGVDESERTN
ncbi:cadherin-18-like isoform X2 [Carcharodon carcharias]|uniref:cadherin-18-like isoform X2 n=1 Tax=Carcharodon carcharias TaxID=13397 RepID=UPI001B7ECB13|nr:cadherin-18-like isoform X2 [Carcharodon carcharias]